MATLPQIKAIQSNLDLDQVDSSDREQFGLIASRIDVAAKSLQALERQQSTTLASRYLKLQNGSPAAGGGLLQGGCEAGWQQEA